MSYVKPTGSDVARVTVPSGSSNYVGLTWAVSVVGAVFLEVQFNESTTQNFMTGYFMIQSDGVSAVEYNQFNTLLISDPGVTLTSDISGGFIRLLITTTATGNSRLGNIIIRTLAKL